MRSIVTKIFLFAVFPVLLMTTSAHGQDAEGLQFWHRDSIEATWKEPWSIRLEEDFRFGEGLERFIYEHTDLGLIYKANEGLKFSIHYRHIYKIKDDVWEKEKRPHLNAILSWRLADFEFSDRNRIERRLLSNTKDIWRYRNKLTVKYPIAWKGKTISPFLSDEFFFDFDQSTFHYQRISAGIAFVFTEKLTADIYYLRQNSEGRTTPKYLATIGSSIEYKF